MKKVFLLPSVLLLSVAIYAQSKPAKKVTKTKKSMSGTTLSSTGRLKTENDSVSYAVGLMMGNYMKSMDLASVNYKFVNMAIESALQGKPGLMNGDEANQCMGKLNQARTQKASAGEKGKSTQFLAENKKRAGVMTTPSGLQYEILTKGTGERLSATDTFKAHYAGSLINGKEFDNSYKRGKPLTLPVGSVIKGWTEALTLMPIGSKWKLFIPSEIGYGDNGSGQDIPGGAALIFEVELLGKGTAADMKNNQ